MKSLWRFDAANETLRALGVGGRALFLCFSLLLVVSSVALVYLLKEEVVVEVPSRGGSLTEGLIGTPRFINPVLSLSDADRDLTALVYSGLLRATPRGGYESDLASEYEISEDGRVYTVLLREGLTFHDGTPLTAADVVFTVHKAQDPALKSPLRANWDGVLAEVVDPRTVRFTLKSAYAPFVENLTLGILPESRWGTISSDEFPFSELNASPVGSGPYRVDSVARSSSGIPSTYTLRAFGGAVGGAPYLSSITLRFYQNEEALLFALQRGEIDSASGISPAKLKGFDEDVRTSPLNRVFGVFFNQNQSALLRDASVRRALGDALQREEMIEAVLGGYGSPLSTPVPPTLFGEAVQHSSSTQSELSAAAQNYLLGRGWTLGEDGVLQKTSGTGKNASTVRLEFALTTANIPELRAAAEYLKEAWGAMGAKVEVKIFEQGDLAQNVIRPRKYDALLFGEVIGRELDLFAFWHSSQRNDPGLNVAGYANAAADRALENLRETTDPAKRQEYLQAFLAELQKDLPAVFLYAPDFVYSIPNDISGVELGFIETPRDRFQSVAQWHREKDSVWPFLAGN